MLMCAYIILSFKKSTNIKWLIKIDVYLCSHKNLVGLGLAESDFLLKAK